MKIIYYIPHKSFFSLHPYGRVTHAIGVANGLNDNGNIVTMVAEEGIRNYLNRISEQVRLYTLKAFKFQPHLKFILNRSFINDCDMFLYRKTVFSLFWIVLFRVFYLNRKFKIATEVNGFIFDYNQKFKSKLVLQDIISLIHKLILRFDDLIYVVNEDLEAILSTGFFSIDKRKIVVIHNGGPRPSLLNLKNDNEDKINLIYFGILADYNELDLIIDVVKDRTNQFMHVIGFGDQLSVLKSKASGNPNIVFYGAKSFQEFGELLESLSGISLGLLPNKQGNSKSSLSPIKAFDYMSFGLPLIFSDVCLQNLITSGVEGESYKVGDLSSLINAIEKASDPTHYLNLRSNVLKNYSNHTWTARMSTLNKALKSCVEL
jgi:hypothetical protein